jgi:hypothetical protein
MGLDEITREVFIKTIYFTLASGSLGLQKIIETH